MAAPTFVQATTAGTGLTIAYGTNVTIGHFLISVILEQGSPNPPVTSISDTLNNDWTMLTGGMILNYAPCSVWTATAKASGANTLTGNHTFASASVAEYTAAKVDIVSSFLSGDGVTVVNPLVGNPITTRLANETLVGWAATNGVLAGAGGGYTIDATTGGFTSRDNTEHQTVSAIGTYSANFINVGIAGNWGCGVFSIYNPSDYPSGISSNNSWLTVTANNMLRGSRSH